MAKKIHVFTDCDLDGAASLLAFHWLLKPKNTTHTIVTVNGFRETFKRWLKTNRLKDYEKIFILDLDVSQDSLDLVDHKNVAIIDHHDTHCQNADKYKNATTIIELCTSCAKLIYTKFKHVNNISPHQQYLILLADDYDSYELKLKDSYNLNVVYWAYQGDRFEKFKRDFFNGFFEFNKFQHNIIKFNEKKLNSLKQTIDVFEATIPIQNTPVKFVSTFAESCINEIAEHIIQKHNSDIGLVVNLKSGKVSLRKSSKCDVHLGNLAKKLLNGGGHEYAAGGTLSDSESFVSLTKLFKPLS